MVSERSIRPHIAVKRNPGHSQLFAQFRDLGLLFSHRGLRPPDLGFGQGELAPPFPASGSGRRQARSGPFADQFPLKLNKGEQAHRFADAISFSRNQEFLYAEKTEQEIAEGCNRLIRNAIICWNYLYLSQVLAQEAEEERRQALLAALKEGSIVIWHHLNLHGEYDFSEEKLQDSVGFELPKILAVDVS